MKEVKTKAEFDECLKVAGDKLVIVDFHAQWCGPCKMVAPKIEELSKTHSDCVFFKVDVDDNDETAQSEGISAMPTFRFYKGGKQICEVVGADVASVEKKIKDNK